MDPETWILNQPSLADGGRTATPAVLTALDMSQYELGPGV